MKKAKYFYLLRRGFFGGGGGLSVDYVKALEADGGAIESRICINNSFKSFNSVSIDLLNEAEAYQTAVLAESGSPVVESFSCLRNSFTELNNVAV